MVDFKVGDKFQWKHSEDGYWWPTVYTVVEDHPTIPDAGKCGVDFDSKGSHLGWMRLHGHGIEYKLVEPTPETSNVESPSHYGNGEIECITYIKDVLTEEEWIGYLRGNIIKYQHRWRYKNGLEDLKKSDKYLEWLLETVSGVE